MTRVTRRTAAALAGATALALTLAACGSSGGSSSSGSSGSSSSSAAKPTKADAKKPGAATWAALGKLPVKVDSAGAIVVGNPSAKNTLAIYEDPRCPYCKQFETTNIDTLAAAAASGKIKFEYTLASFLDANLGGDGSKRAVNALRAAVDKGQGKFPQMHALIYENQPEETDKNAFENKDLIGLAMNVDGLADASFDKAVNGNQFSSFVTASEKKFQEDLTKKKVQLSTPTVFLNDKQVSAANLMDAGKFSAVLKGVGITA
ncbi:hypothetical protein BIV57_11385 [Mangrovactinospora gilvigrisea]|uniref:Thioredoxin-like fold domain-containing protein n=1 Tax=Mangrovactinospora gilvigrisea TaxID=1428644 RepID=A0A1J7C733_9ACTN|nr:thioredoxin domain-containing protein [Mangrovactinospora gilvigrisea]OIV37340.1 hypothetical protein BIV57_11385 [Mangrovactinospora gilvigrisea]